MATRTSDFEPPSHIPPLISAINDGAKSANAGTMVFLLVGLYLVATAFSASDEDLLVGKVMTISQVGASLPMTFCFAIAPGVFVFLHIYTLVRYAMLATNVRYFVGALNDAVPVAHDREYCRQLLTNVEFVLAMAAPPGSTVHSRIWPWLFRTVVCFVPVAILLLVQISVLRYQSELLVWTQRLWLAIDLLALVWFFWRCRPDLSPAAQTGRRIPVLRWIGLLWAPVAVVAFNLLYLNVVPADADAALVRYGSSNGEASKPLGRRAFLLAAVQQPLDLTVCQWLHWGCRYLRVEQRTLVDKVWDEKIVAKLRSHELLKDTEVTELGVEGIVLRGRTLRFAVLDYSRLYSADMTDADLRGASLRSADLTGAVLGRTQLGRAALHDTMLQRTRMMGTDLVGASLLGAALQEATLSDLKMQGADLRSANFSGAFLMLSDLRFADLGRAELTGATLVGVDLRLSNLQGATVAGSSLLEVKLAGADLTGADLRGARLDQASLWHAFTEAEGMGESRRGPANVSLADWRGVTFGPSADDKERKEERDKEQKDLQPILESIAKELREAAQKRFDAVFSDKPPALTLLTDSQRPVLVSPGNKAAQELQQKSVIVVLEEKADQYSAYKDGLMRYLVRELAPRNPETTWGIMIRGMIELDLLSGDEKMELDSLLCRMLSENSASRIKLHRKLVELTLSMPKFMSNRDLVPKCMTSQTIDKPATAAPVGAAPPPPVANAQGQGHK